jgi:hypothetical protein
MVLLVGNNDLIATETPEIVKHLRGDGAALLCKENLGSGRMTRRALYCDQPEARATASRFLANAPQISAHDVTIEVKLAGVCAHWLTFFKGNG